MYINNNAQRFLQIGNGILIVSISGESAEYYIVGKRITRVSTWFFYASSNVRQSAVGRKRLYKHYYSTYLYNRACFAIDWHISNRAARLGSRLYFIIILLYWSWTTWCTIYNMNSHTYEYKGFQLIGPFALRFESREYI